MDEEGYAFHQNNLGIYPTEHLKSALSYILSILNILLSYNKDLYKEMFKLITKQTKRLGVKATDLMQAIDMDKIVDELEAYPVDLRN